MIVKIKDKKTEIICWSILSIVILLVAIPIFSGNVMKGDDLNFHLLRIESLKDALSSGQFPARIDTTHLGGYGYGTSLFYPNLFLYLPALLRTLDISLTSSYLFFLFVIITATTITAYICGKHITKNNYGGVLVAIIYSLCEYHIINLYVRAAVGEALAGIFIPLTILGLYNLLYENYSHPKYLVIGLVGTFYCHTISFYMLALISLILFIMNLAKFWNSLFPWKTFFISISISILLCLAFFLPFVEQIVAQDITAFTRTSGYKYTPTGIPISHLFNLPLSMNYQGKISYSIGAIPIILCTLRFLPAIRHIPKQKKKLIDFFLYTGFTLVFISTNIFPWKYFQWLLGYIQFSWRIFAIAPLFLAIAIAYMSIVLLQDIKMKSIFTSLTVASMFAWVLLSTIVPTTKTIYRPIEVNDFSQLENTYYIGTGEWLPTATKLEDIKATTTVTTAKKQMLPFKKLGTDLEFSLLTNTSYVDVPLLYYKGYQASYIDPNNQITPLKVEKTKNNTIRVSNFKNTGGKVIVTYQETFIQKLSFQISLYTALGIIWYTVIKKKFLS